MVVRHQNTESENNTNRTENNPFCRMQFQNIIHISKVERNSAAGDGTSSDGC